MTETTDIASSPTRPLDNPDHLEVEPLGPSFGAIVHGVQLNRVGPADISAIRAALVDRKVLFFPQQELSDEEQVRFGNQLGQLTVGHPVADVDASRPEIYDIDSSDPEFSFSDVWHTDVTFMSNPPAASILRAVRLPPTGGDTSWADSQAAYASLADPVQRLVDDLSAVHDGNREWGQYLRRRGGGNEWEGKPVAELASVEHPVVRVHPETGRKGLFVKPGFTSHIVGVSEAESAGLLSLLYAHLIKPEHTIRHRWTVGDVGIWDNRSTAHYANRDYTATRIMRRVTLRGDRPYGPRSAT